MNIREIITIIKNQLRDLLVQKAEKITPLLPDIKPFAALLSVPLIIYLLSRLLIAGTPVMDRISLMLRPEMKIEGLSKDSVRKAGKTVIPDENLVKRLERAYSRYLTSQPYLIVNTTGNTFTLFNRGKVVRQGQCSTGSYILLDAGDTRKWMFETPKGMFRVQGKTEYPVWKKPDWAFVEEGLPVPPATSHLRYEYGVLGDYALSIGNGYLIHGTLYKRLLGMPVTHGCVRLDDEDLEAVFHTLTIGSKVYIF